jgi:isocitrate/isopropylmalate dehydrogenase
MAMILACAALLSYIPDPKAASASRAIYESVVETVRAGIATSDLGGSASTTELTEAVIDRVQSKLEVWASL